jgi:hypothetical protein
MNDLFHPKLSLLVKLGSIAVHADEMLSPGAHEFDMEAIKPLLRDPDLKEWIKQMTEKGFMPVRRNQPKEEQR